MNEEPDPLSLGAAANPYGGHGVPAGTPPPRPVDPVAVAALVTSLLCLAPVGLAIGLFALRRSRDGRTYGRPLAVLAVTASVIVLVAAPVGWAASGWISDRFPAAQDVRAGDCVDVSQANSFIHRDCDDEHWGEVVATGELTSTEEILFGGSDAAEFCTPHLDEDDARAARTGRYAVGVVVQVGIEERPPQAGDRYACYLSDIDGDELTGPIEVPSR